MSYVRKVELADIERLERENRELQKRVGDYDRQILLKLRAITLEKQNATLREIVAQLPKPVSDD